MHHYNALFYEGTFYIIRILGVKCQLENEGCQTFKGITPYLPSQNPNDKNTLCNQVTIPVLEFNHGFNSEKERLTSIREWVYQQPEITELRKQNLWTDLSDRILEGGVFFRTAEHSAQQPAKRLQQFEALFKAEKLNVLSCSTTMEMGVDIGGISSVAMNNVPPHPANYLQRTGRAGRRQETRALAFTICKDNPHERNVFNKPLWAFTTHIKSPYITLSSQRIVQRHVNSLIFSYFLNQIIAVEQKNNLQLTCEWFFCSDEDNTSTIERFNNWLEECCLNEISERLQLGLKSLVKNSVLAQIKQQVLLKQTQETIHAIWEKWLPDYQALENELNSMAKENDKSPYKRRIEHDLKRLTSEYLLSELAVRGFLPSYGFPLSVASLNPFTIEDYKKQQQQQKDKIKPDVQLNRYRDQPSRDLSIAIREYAPSNNIVINGLSYRSAGITLNWHTPDENVHESQKLSIAWRCHHCGAIGHEPRGSQFNRHCSECGQSLQSTNIYNFIEPTGFAVDFYESPTTDVSIQHYIPVKEPLVTANDKFRSLPNPNLGGFRSGTEGKIFYYSSGEHNKGYAICLACGRADSMMADNSMPKSLSEKPHRKLRGDKNESSVCQSNTGSTTIQTNLHLGCVEQTDVFELYLKSSCENQYLKDDTGQENNTNEKIAWTLSIVLRQALADNLGINADELGYSVKPTILPDCEYPVATIVIYDNCSGGAGFSSSAHIDFEALFNKARQSLKCEHCNSVCQNCLLGFDTRFHIDKLDRHLALDFLNDNFMNQLALPENMKFLGENSRYAVESLWTEISQSAAKGATQLQLFLQGQPQDWVLTETLKDNLHHWQRIYQTVTLVIDKQTTLDDIIKEDLWVLQRLGIQIATIEAAKINAKKVGYIIVQTLTETNKSYKTFASNDKTMAIPTQNWLTEKESLVVFAQDYPIITLSEYLNAEQLKPQTHSGDVEVEILTECNGALTQFSQKFWQRVIKEHQTLQQHINAQDSLLSISYSDAYLHNPWTIILITELITGLRQHFKENWNKPTIQIQTAPKNQRNEYQRNGLFADWLDDSLRLDVIEAYFSGMNETCIPQISSNTAHGRSMELKWKSGNITTIRLDQGIGYWGCDVKAPWFDNRTTAQEQADDMKALIPKLKVKNHKDFPTQIFIKERDNR